MNNFYQGNNTYKFPFNIGDELYICTCMGMVYSVDEINKCGGYKVTHLRVLKDGKCSFDAEKDSGNSVGMMPMELFGVVVFTDKKEAISALHTLNEFKQYFYENDELEDLDYDALLEVYRNFLQSKKF